MVILGESNCFVSWHRTLQSSWWQAGRYCPISVSLQISVIPRNSCHQPLTGPPSAIPLHHSKTSRAAEEKWPFILIPPAVPGHLSVLWCPSGEASVEPFLAHTPGFLALLKNTALSSLNNAPVTVCVSGHEPSQKHMTEKVLYWLQLFDRKKKSKIDYECQ